MRLGCPPPSLSPHPSPSPTVPPSSLLIKEQRPLIDAHVFFSAENIPPFVLPPFFRVSKIARAETAGSRSTQHSIYKGACGALRVRAQASRLLRTCDTLLTRLSVTARSPFIFATTPPHINSPPFSAVNQPAGTPVAPLLLYVCSSQSLCFSIPFNRTYLYDATISLF